MTMKFGEAAAKCPTARNNSNNRYIGFLKRLATSHKTNKLLVNELKVAR